MSKASPFSDLFHWLLNPAHVPESQEISPDEPHVAPAPGRSMRAQVIRIPIEALDDDAIEPLLADLDPEDAVDTEEVRLPEGWLHFENWAIQEHHDIRPAAVRDIEAYIRSQRARSIPLATIERRLQDISRVNLRFGWTCYVGHRRIRRILDAISRWEEAPNDETPRPT